MIKLYICCLVLIIGSVEVGPDIDMKFHQEVMEIVSYDNIVEQKPVVKYITFWHICNKVDAEIQVATFGKHSISIRFV